MKKLAALEFAQFLTAAFKNITCQKLPSLFVFSLSDPKQNARLLLTPVSGTVVYALSHGSLGFALHGSFFNHLLIG